MTSRVLQFIGLSDRDRQDAGPMLRISKGDRIDLRVRGATGGERTLALPPTVAAMVESIVDHLLRGERVAILAEDQEISPNDAAIVLGMSRPLVAHRMDAGDLPFRYVGKHRRAKLRDVLTLKEKVDAQRVALAALAEDTEDLIRDHGL
jgi:hypothetical protein